LGKRLYRDLHLMPLSEPPRGTLKRAGGRIMHAALKKGSVVLMASGAVPGMPLQQADNFSICVTCNSFQETESLFSVIGEQSAVTT
jgi:uncharacterized glyoxalase superfamily protein PhnB